MDAPFSFKTRQANLATLATEPFDLLIIGAGITGAGIARDAAMRGITTALIDKGDFGSGTSSHSSRLIHGGLRYLEHRHFKLVFEASRERRTLLRIAPHLVWQRSFLFPIHDSCRLSRWKLAAGLWLYDLLAAFRNVRRHEMLGKRALLRAEPGLRAGGLKGGARYYDAQCDDVRLTLANVRDAHRYGARVANYVKVGQVEVADGLARGAWVTDLVTGKETTIRARSVVNATGPWSDELSGVPPEHPTLHLSKGAHVLVPASRLGNHEALTLISPIDGRVLFVIPWGELSYIGTTETEVDPDPDGVRADAADVTYLLRTANAFFPEARLTPDDVQATWAGLRPLLRLSSSEDPNAVSREHAIMENSHGLISIVGGKLTTYRQMAAETVDRVARRLHELDGRPVPRRARTDRHPLPGGETHDLDGLSDAAVDDGVPLAVAKHLVRAYGSETPAVVRLALSDPRLASQVAPPHPTIWAEFLHAIRREMAITLGDLLIRRTHMYYEVPHQARDVIEPIADLAAEEMGWDQERRRAELAAYEHEVARSEAFRAELDQSGELDAPT